MAFACCLAVKKENGVLQFMDYGSYEQRNASTIQMIRFADTVYNWNDFNTILVQTDDMYNHVRFPGIDLYCSYSKKDTFQNLIPDFAFGFWPYAQINDYTEMTQQIYKTGQTTPSIMKVGWIGQPTVHVRKLLMEHGQKYPFLFDFFDSAKSPFMNMLELISKYAFLIDAEGNGYSARLKLFFWSKRPLIIIDRPDKEYFFEYLVPWVHYIPVKRDTSDLLENTIWILQNSEKAKVIAENAFAFAMKYLTREAACKQWNAVITGTRPTF